MSDATVSTTLLSAETLTEDEAVAMAAYYAGIVRPLAHAYPRWPFLDIYPEETRIVRALYRFQLCCNLFGQGEREPNGPRARRCLYDEQYILNDFLGAFEPWEAEEIVCIYASAREIYEQVFVEVSWDLTWSSPEFRERLGEGSWPKFEQ
ncbi:hypothetical protein VTK26DRAFT_4958 [Humicola hyalothermophila]